MAALMEGNVDIMEKLLQVGADVSFVCTHVVYILMMLMFLLMLLYLYVLNNYRMENMH